MKDSSAKLIVSCTGDEALQDVISLIMEKEGFRLIKAPDERMLFSLIEEYGPGVVIIDSGITEIMGYRPWEIMRKLDRFRDVKIVLITSVLLQYLEGVYDLADEVIERDIVSDQILPVIRRFMLPDESIMSNGITNEDMQMHEDARRLARAIVSDIVYYNSEKALIGASDGTFTELLVKEIEEGRMLYQRRVSQNILSVSDYYDCAIRDFIQKIQQCNLVLP